MSIDVCKYVRGGIWWADIPEKLGRGILSGNHMVMIFSAVSNPSSVCQISVIPISSMKSSNYDEERLHNFYAIPINVKNYSCYVCCNQIFPISTQMLTSYVGQTTGQKIKEVEREVSRWLQMGNVFYNEIGDSAENKKSDLIEKSEEIRHDEIEVIEDKKKSTSPKSVICIETGEISRSVRQASLKYNVSKIKLQKIIANNQSVWIAGQEYHFKYHNR